MNEEHYFFVQCIRNNGELLGESFRLQMSGTTYVSDIKKLVKVEKAPELDHIAADRLILWKLKQPQPPYEIRKKDFFEKLGVLSEENEKIRLLEPVDKVSSVESWPEGLVHVLAQLPAPEAGATDCISAESLFSSYFPL